MHESIEMLFSPSYYQSTTVAFSVQKNRTKFFFTCCRIDMSSGRTSCGCASLEISSNRSRSCASAVLIADMAASTYSMEGLGGSDAVIFRFSWFPQLFLHEQMMDFSWPPWPYPEVKVNCIRYGGTSSIGEVLEIDPRKFPWLTFLWWRQVTWWESGRHSAFDRC